MTKKIFCVLKSLLAVSMTKAITINLKLTRMNKYFLLLLTTVVLSGYGCKKGDKAGPEDTNPTSYRLRSMTWSQGQVYSFTYKNGLVSRIDNGTSIILNGQTYTMNDYTTYEYTDGLCTKATSYCGGCSQDGNYITYEYNSTRQAIRENYYYKKGAFAGYSSFQYDSNGKLIEKDDSTTGGTVKQAYTYNSAGNLSHTVSRTKLSSPNYPDEAVEEMDWKSFDDKVNFIRTVNGLPVNYPSAYNMGVFLTQSTNNYWYSQNTDYRYEYNDEGLPVKIFYAGLTVTLDYEKYK